MNTEIDNLTTEEVLQRVDELVSENENAYVVTPNVDHIVKLETNKELREAYKHASLILTDGKPLVWISKLYKTPIKEKISGSDLFPQICERAAAKGYKMFFLGAAEGIADRAAKNLTQKYPNLQVVGTYSPPIGFEKDNNLINETIRRVKKTNPQILIIGLGCPKQELFLLHNREKLGVPVSFCMGASLDFEAGVVKRAPKWMSEHGLEWLYRTFQEPKRMLKRYFREDLKIFRLAWKYR